MTTVQLAQALLTEEREKEAALLLMWSRSLSEHRLSFDVYVEEQRQAKRLDREGEAGK